MWAQAQLINSPCDAQDSRGRTDAIIYSRLRNNLSHLSLSARYHYWSISACRTKWADCVREDLWPIVRGATATVSSRINEPAKPSTSLLWSVTRPSRVKTPPPRSTSTREAAPGGLSDRRETSF